MKEYFSDMKGDPLEASALQEQGGDWATSWADLMMVMFVLFTVLFVYAGNKAELKVLFSPDTAERAKETNSIDPLLGLIGNLSGLADSSNAVNGPAGYQGEVVFKARDNAVTVLREGDSMRVIMRGDIFFAPGGESLLSGADEYLDEIGSILRTTQGNVMVVGYAAATELEGKSGFSLSAGRAESVAERLIGRYGMRPERIAVTGRGAHSPDVPAYLEDSADLNRRVEIIMVTR
ncbi:OmpA/MotB family protein [Desulfovibrio oxyclinae]|uniref:OmpA/MotB family protein n=1 Tax=Desulfovibrio oxyclinae TaxID=63560 RepID=UPI0003823167|nr:OmpA family protein [Desulfovibrio oxyclinae]